LKLLADPDLLFIFCVNLAKMMIDWVTMRLGASSSPFVLKFHPNYFTS